MTDRPLTTDELSATFEAIDNAQLAREERELRREEARQDGDAPCPGVGEYGRGLTGKAVHWGCCPAGR